MEFGTIEREIHIEATPEVVYQVVSTPEHIKEWYMPRAWGRVSKCSCTKSGMHCSIC